MPSRPIQGFPLGFLSLLGLKNLGKLPDMLLDEVRPGIDLEGWYLRGNAEVVSAALTGNATGGFQTTAILPNVVPNDEIWFIHSFGGTFTTAAPPASGVFFAELNIRDRTGLQNRGGRTFPIPVTTGASRQLVNLENFWLFPGEALGAAWFMAAGDLIEIAQVVATRLRV